MVRQKMLVRHLRPLVAPWANQVFRRRRKLPCVVRPVSQVPSGSRLLMPAAIHDDLKNHHAAVSRGDHVVIITAIIVNGEMWGDDRVHNGHGRHE